ncbi:hypothetical protein [Nostoc sp. CCY0012]|uniref:hypothetical protein n=1 Tax=Nostoc sp. CCY0012 TaxID=1056123 RepID=UPI0039C5AF1C
MKLANPLYYPLSVLIGSIVLFIGVRLVQLPNQIIIPLSIGISLFFANFFQYREPKYFELDNPELEQEITAVQIAALTLANRANELRLEAKNLLTIAEHERLLATIERSCDRAIELPGKIRNIVWYLYGSNSLVSVGSLQRQLTEIQQKKMRLNSGYLEKQHLSKLAENIKRNIKLAKKGEDTRLSRIFTIYHLIEDYTVILERYDDKLSDANLINLEELQELQLLGDELKSLEEIIDLLVRK